MHWCFNSVLPPTTVTPHLQSVRAHGEHVHSRVHASRTCNHYSATPPVVKNPTGHLSFCIILVNLFYPLSAVSSFAGSHVKRRNWFTVQDQWIFYLHLFLSLFSFNVPNQYQGHHQTSVEKRLVLWHCPTSDKTGAVSHMQWFLGKVQRLFPYWYGYCSETGFLWTLWSLSLTHAFFLYKNSTLFMSY